MSARVFSNALYMADMVRNARIVKEHQPAEIVSSPGWWSGSARTLPLITRYVRDQFGGNQR